MLDIRRLHLVPLFAGNVLPASDSKPETVAKRSLSALLFVAADKDKDNERLVVPFLTLTCCLY